MGDMEKKKADWYKDLIVYQIYPRSYMDSNGDGIGDLRGIIGKLDYIAELGVNAIWLTPIYPSPCYDNGYDISDYRSIDPMYGTFDDFIEFRDGCHRRGIAIIMDLVVNHTSSHHMWFQESRKSRTGRYSDYYIWKDPVDGHEPNNWAGSFGGSAWEYVPERGQYYLHLFSKEQPDLNWECEELREEVVSIIRWWGEQGVDGFRVDAISYLEKAPGFPDSPEPPFSTGFALAMDICSNREGTHRYISELNRRAFAPYHMMTVGEVNCRKLSDYHDYASQSRHEFDMCIPFVPPIVEINTWSPLAMKKSIMETYEELKDDGWWARFLSNHDKPRQVSLYGDDGKYRVRSAKMLCALMEMLPGTPFVYQGEEIGMANVYYGSIEEYDDPSTQDFYREMIATGHTPEEALREAQLVSRDNARSPMQWTAGVNAGFSTERPWLGVNPDSSEWNAESQIGEKDSIFSFYKEMIALRKSSEAIRRGDLRFILPDDPAIFAFERTLGSESYFLIADFSSDPVPFPVDLSGYGDVVVSNTGRVAIDKDMVLEPYEAIVIRKR